MPSSVVLLYILGIAFNVYVPCPCVFVPFPVFLSRLPVCLSPCLFPCFRPLFPIPVFSSFVPYPRVSVLCPLSPCFVLCSRVSVPCPRVFPSPEPWFSPLSSVFSSLALGFPSPVPVFVPFWRVPVPCPLAPLHLVSVPCPLPVTVFPGPVFFVFVFEQALSKHIAHLFSRDPLVIFEGRIEEVDDEEEVCVDWWTGCTIHRSYRVEPKPKALFLALRTLITAVLYLSILYCASGTYQVLYYLA